MSSLTRGAWSLLAAALVLSLTAQPLFAQRGRSGSGLGLYGFGPRLGENIQLALENQTTLGLSQEQVQVLDDLQTGIQRDVAPLASKMDGIRQSILDGEVDPIRGLSRLRDLEADFVAAADSYRSRVASVLSAEQHLALQEMMYTTRASGGLGRGGLGVSGIPSGSDVTGVPIYPGRGLGPGAGLRSGGDVGLRSPLATGQASTLGAGQAPGLGIGRGPGLGLGRGAGIGRGRGRLGGRGLGRRVIWR